MPGKALHLGAGIGLAILAWLLPRRVARARWRNLPALALDALPVALLWGLLLVATARPLFAGFVALALIGGLALADRVKRDTLREPVVFSDMAELPYLFTHPHLYLPFAGTGMVVGGAALALAVALLMLLLERALWSRSPAPAPSSGPRDGCLPTNRGSAPPPRCCAGSARPEIRSPTARASVRSRACSSTAS